MLRYLLEKEFKQLMRNRFLPRVVVVLPFMALLLFPLVADFEIKNINLSVVDNDHTTLSARLVHKVEASGYFRITGYYDSYDQAMQSIDRNKADAILQIPLGSELGALRGEPLPVLIASNTTNGMRGGLSSSYLASIVQAFYVDNAGQSVAQDPGQSVAQSASKVPGDGLEIVPSYRFNPRLVYRLYMIPAIMVMMLAVICGFLPALNIVSEKENGTIEQMNVTPVSRPAFILAKLIPYWVAGFIVLTICFLVAWIMYGFLPEGSFVTIYLFSALFVLAMSGFGLVISNYAKTIQQGIFMIFFFVITFIFMSGLYTPIASMPQWAQILSHASPLRYIISVFRLVYLKGSTGTDLAEPLFALITFAIIFNGWAILSYRKTN
ncbi:MAG: ABC transporter permease [Bacteroidales bacterium]|nr:ABC transporter permease [Bacteroidales bacterium]